MSLPPSIRSPDMLRSVPRASYALLIAPSSNRVYSRSAAALAVAELEVFNQGFLGGKLGEARQIVLGSVDYLMFEAGDLGKADLAWISNLSCAFALFRRDGESLFPLELERMDQLDSDLLTIQKYAGKTNENFTKLLINVTLSACAARAAMSERKLRLLDPLCGRGTSLNQALMYGFDASGVEIDERDFEAYATFIQRWVKDKRLKHEAQVGQLKGHRKLSLSFGLDKQGYKAGKTLNLEFVSADTLAIGSLFSPRAFDLIVADAPYGVKHGSSTSGRAVSRAPGDLLKEAAPIWREALREGGALGIAWNTHVLERAELARILAQSGFEVRDAAPYTGFAHRVDQAILRDVMVATK